LAYPSELHSISRLKADRLLEPQRPLSEPLLIRQRIAGVRAILAAPLVHTRLEIIRRNTRDVDPKKVSDLGPLEK
jgi:hypothetical protein